MNKISGLDDYKNKQVVLYGVEEVAYLLWTSLKKHNVNVIAYCGLEREPQKTYDSVEFVPYQDCEKFLLGGGRVAGATRLLTPECKV